MKKRSTLTRKEFIKTGAALLGGGLLISIPSVAEGAFIGKLDMANPAIMNAWLRIGNDNSIHIILSKVEMGQGIWTTLPMLIAEELDCDWKKIKVQHKAGGKGDDFKEHLFLQSTGGSETTSSGFDRYRLAGATAREMLKMAAGKKWSIAPTDCKTENGYIIFNDQRLSYGEVAIDASSFPVPTVKLREPAEWKYIGKSQKRLDIADKINGAVKYGWDLHFPGMLTAVIARPPIFGATVKSVDASEAMKIAGIKDVVVVPEGVAVVGDHYWAVKSGRDALKVDWSFEAVEKHDNKKQLEQYRSLVERPGFVSQKKGDVSQALAKSKKRVSLEFILPYLAHAPMETLNCVVKIDKDKCEVWSGTQSPLVHQQEVAAYLGFKPEQVEFHTPALGGSFGRRGSLGSDWVMEAVHIAKATGKFVKLVWSREDDIKGGHYRPFYLHRIDVGMDDRGLPIAWQHRIVGQSLFINTLLEKYIVVNGTDYGTVSGVHGSPYLESIADHSVELHSTMQTVPVLSWRSVSHTHTAFVMETLIDEFAVQVSQDPVEFRRTLLQNHPRHLSALDLAVEKAEWKKPLPPGMHRGVAVHGAMGSYVAQVVEMSVADKKIKVHRVVCAIDCGLAVNPDGVIAQMEGSIIFALTAALYGEITWEDGRVKQGNFNDYKMLRINQTPVIEVHIVSSNEKMGGAGEPGVPPLAPALANAVFSATGKRLRQLPIRLEDIN